MKWPERWLVVRLRQNGKNRIRSYCYGTAVTAQRQVGTATAKRQRNGGNQALVKLYGIDVGRGIIIGWCCWVYSISWSAWYKSWTVDPSSAVYYRWLLIISVAVIYNLIVVVARSIFWKLHDNYACYWMVTDFIADVIYLTDILVNLRTGLKSLIALARPVNRRISRRPPAEKIIWLSRRFSAGLFYPPALTASC